MKDLTIVIPAWHEAANLALLLPDLNEAAKGLGIDYEILVADHPSGDGTEEVCARQEAVWLRVPGRGYGEALRAGFAASSGRFVLTMDADLSHPSDFIRVLWEHRQGADVTIASRYVAGGRAEMPFSRRLLSGVLNWTFARTLSVPLRDLSSGFRLYRKDVLEEIHPAQKDFDILQELLVRAYALGYRVAEVPFTYRRRGSGSSHARLFAFGVRYAGTLWRMWRLRNSIESGDYDLRAFDSRLPMQRWWQRKRYRIILEEARGSGPVLDVGCGSSRILEALPPGSVGLDPSLPNLRYARRSGKEVLAGALPRVPVTSEKFRAVVCSQVIEHIPEDGEIFREFHRLVAPGGVLILGTPDYGRFRWRATEALYHLLVPGGYADEHITRYTAEGLRRRLREAGFTVEETRYVGGGEMIMRCRKASRRR